MKRIELPELPPVDFQPEGALTPEAYSGDAVRAYALAAYRKAVEDSAKAVPTNWLDSILTGPHAVIADGNEFSPTDIELVLLAVATRIRRLVAEE